MTLFQESGGTEQSRINEAQRIATLLSPKTGDMTPHEVAFVQKMLQTTKCSPKQIFWLRDLLEKYL